MNISLKETTILECLKCPDVFMKIGEIAAIRLGHPRKQHRDNSGQVLKGTCPKHVNERTTLK